MGLSLFNFLNIRRTKEENPYSPRRGFSFSKNITVTEDSAMKVSAFNSGVIYLSTQVAKLPLNIKDKDNNIIDDDIAYLINTQPNDEMNSFDFRLLMMQHSIIEGNFFAEIERLPTGRVINLWPLDPRLVQVVREDSGLLWYRCAGRDGGFVYLRPKDIFHIKNFHLTRDGILGQGMVAYAIETLGIATGADAMAKGILANGGMPSGVISVQGSLSDQAAVRLKESWDAAHGGRKTGGTAVLEEGATYSPVQFQPDALQFLDSRKFTVLEIARFLRIPPVKLYDIMANSYNTQEQSNLEVATDTIHPWTARIQSEIDVKILNRRFAGRKSEFDLYDLFKGDQKTRSDYFSKMFGIGGITSNEIRKKEGHTPYPEGDKFYISANNLTPVDRVDEVIDSQVSKGNSGTQSNPGSLGTGSKALEDAATKFLTER